MISHQFLIVLNEWAAGSPVVSLVVVSCARWLPYLLVSAALLYTSFPLLRARDRTGIRDVSRNLSLLTISAFISGVAVELWKLAYPVARPFFDLSFAPLVSVDDPLGSFPSSHASIFAALGMTIYLHNKKAGAWFLFGALLVGVARVASGVHYPIDILVGFLLGGAIALLLHGIFAKTSVGKKE